MTLRHRLDLTLEVGLPQVHLGVPTSGEHDRLVVIPRVLIHVRIQVLAHKPFLTGLRVHHHEPVLVALVSVPLHGLPSNPLSVRRIARIGVVAFVVLRDVLMRACVHVIEVDVAVGRNGIVESCLLTAGVSDLRVVGVPRQLLHAAERFHRALERGALKDIHTLSDLGRLDALSFAVVRDLQRTDERLRSGLGPFVPMFVHQVLVHMSGCQRQIGVLVHGLGDSRHLFDENDLIAHRGEQETLDVLCSLYLYFLFVATQVELAASQECEPSSAPEPGGFVSDELIRNL